MPLTFLCAGCSQDERDVAESSVKDALGERTRHEAWVVSLVKAGPNWSIRLDGPDYKALSFVAPEPELRDSIRERLEPATAAPAQAAPQFSAPQPAAGLGSKRDRHECRSCRRAFVVTYEVEDDDEQEMVSIACPHRWQLNHVLIAEAAAYTQAFKAEKLEA